MISIFHSKYLIQFCTMVVTAVYFVVIQIHKLVVPVEENVDVSLILRLCHILVFQKEKWTIFKGNKCFNNEGYKHPMKKMSQVLRTTLS